MEEFVRFFVLEGFDFFEVVFLELNKFGLVFLKVFLLFEGFFDEDLFEFGGFFGGEFGEDFEPFLFFGFGKEAGLLN